MKVNNRNSGNRAQVEYIHGRYRRGTVSREWEGTFLWGRGCKRLWGSRVNQQSLVRLLVVRFGLRSRYSVKKTFQTADYRWAPRFRLMLPAGLPQASRACACAYLSRAFFGIPVHMSYVML